MLNIPKSLQRLATEVEGWLDLGCPEKALDRMARLLETPGARPGSLSLHVRALVALGRHKEALREIEELRSFDHDPEWLEITAAWCLKRTGDLEGAAACMRRLLAQFPHCAVAHYNLGCYLALVGNTCQALEEVTIACGMDPRLRREARTETDLEALRGSSDFEALLGPE